MIRAELCAFIILFLLACCFPTMHLFAGNSVENKSKKPEQVIQYPVMPNPGKKVAIGNDYYFIYNFNKKPKLGTVVLKVEMYTPGGERNTSLEVFADAGMPSMRGAHETGERSLSVSKKGDYLIPVNIVMPGDWEIRITVKKDGAVIFRGSYKFDV